MSQPMLAKNGPATRQACELVSGNAVALLCRCSTVIRGEKYSLVWNQAAYLTGVGEAWLNMAGFPPLKQLPIPSHRRSAPL